MIRHDGVAGEGFGAVPAKGRRRLRSPITIELPPAPDVAIAVSLPPDILSPNANRGMPSDLKEARGLVGARNQVGKAYEAEACAQTLRAVRTGGIPEPVGAVLRLTFFWKSAQSRSRRDRDNAAASFKKGQDGIAKGLGINDRRIVQLPPVFEVDKRKPRVEVEVYFTRIEWRYHDLDK